jgi:hypothetical protein
MYCEPERLATLQRLLDTLCKIIDLRAKSHGLINDEILHDEIATTIMTSLKLIWGMEIFSLAVLEVSSITLPTVDQFEVSCPPR